MTVLGSSETSFGLLFGSVMIGSLMGATLGSRLVRQWGIDRMLNHATALMLIAATVLVALAWARVEHTLAVVVPMFFFMIALMMTLPQAMAGGLTPFPEIAGSAASLLSFVQFLIASTSALAVGLAFDGTSRPLASVIAIASLLAFLSFRVLVKPAEASGRAAQRHL